MAQTNNFWKNLGILINGQSVRPEFQRNVGEPLSGEDPVIYTTNSKEDHAEELQKLSQQKFLSYQWVKARQDTMIDSVAGLTATKLMYRDADLMDSSPEIGSALDICSEEACANDSRGQMLHVYSSSKRIKSILEDLFTNRLNINVILPQIARGMMKYGNHYMLLNIDEKMGVKGWMKLPVYEIERIENGFAGYGGALTSLNTTIDMKPDDTKFVWVGRNEGKPFFNWQVAHFRNLSDSFFLPYGVSNLHKARRAWRMWSMMEDAMLIYRLDKSVERRVYKIFVGAIDNDDVPAYVQQVANNLKRTPIIDPETGQVDLRKNFWHTNDDLFIPVRSENAPTPIDSLPSNQSPTAMDDIQYMQAKIFAALRVPKTFLNFQEAQGKGQNLSLMDIRFCRMINKVQQYLLLELNKVALIHLYLMGFRDDINNFSLSLTNPSAQIEALELEDLSKRVQTAAAALADPGTGIPIMSQHRALKEIMKMTDSEIKDMFNEIRLEKAMAGELQQTPSVITKTHVFDTVDRIYGDLNVLNKPTDATPTQESEGDGGMKGGPSSMGGMDMGGSLNMDSLGGPMDDGGDIGGAETTAPMSEAPALDSGEQTQPMEVASNNKPLIMDHVQRSFFEQYMDMLNESSEKYEKEKELVFDYIGKNPAIIKDELDKEITTLSNISSQTDSDAKDMEKEIKKIKRLKAKK